MKLRYFVPILVALLAVFTGCNSDDEVRYLGNLKLSSSFVSLSKDGGSTQITLNASDSWSVQADDVPEWLTISPMSGGAGETKLTFAAEPAAGRTAVLRIVCGDNVQEVNVIQGIAEVSNATCAEVIAGADAKTYRVTGVCTAIANTNYGNWYLQDATGQIYIYGTVDASGKYNWASFGIEVGDVVTVQGPKTTYNGTVELVDVSVLKVVKSLVKIEEGTEAAFDANGGDFIVRLTVSGDGPFVAVDAEAQSWLGITAVEKTDTTTNVHVHVAPNDGEAARKGTISFTSTSGSSSSTVSATVSQMGLMGTKTNPFTVEQAIEYCQTLDGVSGNDFYVKGIISRIINGGEFGSHGNATFYISDDGEFFGEDDKNCDTGHDFEAYRVYYFGNEKWNADVNKANISVGDEVVICGKLTLYKGISETSQNAAYIYSINGVTTDENGVGSLAFPFNTAGAISCIDNGFQGNAYVEGVVSKIVYTFSASYGTGTFWISEDGTFYDDATKDFEAYSVYWLGNKSWVDGDDQIAEGDKVILHGALTKYKTTYETASKKAYVYSVNGKTE